MANFFDTKIEYIKGVGPQKASLLNTELRVFTYGDLIQLYPFRYEDRSRYYKISEISEDLPFVQIRGFIKNISLAQGRVKRLVASFSDGTGTIDLVWFQGIKWAAEKIKPGIEYVVYGKPSIYGHKFNIAHPEIEPFAPGMSEKGLQPVYNTTEKLKAKYLDSKAISKILEKLLETAGNHIQETLPSSLLQKFKLVSKKEAMLSIHYPKDEVLLEKSRKRLKFEELFFIQLKLLHQKSVRRIEFRGQIFKNIPTLNDFYKNHLPFDLTEAQKRVIREIYKDLISGKQMNRLLQGDVGSGKTIVGFIIMLMAIDNGAQTCLMAPTEILADQHYKGLKEFADKLNISIAKLTGSSKTKERKVIHESLKSGELSIIIGTHALLEDIVEFNNLGICIIDEQHRFGVAQRAKLWKKNKEVHPHVLVMTATPIPRTLAMTLYGDLDISVIDEMPAGRKPIKTIHQYDKDRLKVFGFIRKQIEEGRQIYIVYPLIEESEKMDFKDLIDGFESISRAFPEIPISILHGRMKSVDKDFEMTRFAKGETKIMVATTVIEVGVNVPNASVMVIESAERFGLSQLHQLRGRVGRGADQSYCIMMTGVKLGRETRTRLETMVRTNNGFEIADVDLRLRGPGDLTGTQQSGVLDLLIADLSQDAVILQYAREAAMEILDTDPQMENPENYNIKKHIASLNKNSVNWSRIS
ncbi:MAG TPA: ATP-dependent DNA helicase RecG [Cytophagaceae bacterium]|nr:ATP-dependent DNA helicase RecG [Cytophagaceae bacterium]